MTLGDLISMYKNEEFEFFKYNNIHANGLTLAVVYSGRHANWNE